MPARPKPKSARTRKTSYEDPERPPSSFPLPLLVDPNQSGFIDALRKASVLQKTIEKETALLGEEWDIEGYVDTIGRIDSTTTFAMVWGESSTYKGLIGYPLEFPP